MADLSNVDLQSAHVPFDALRGRLVIDILPFGIGFLQNQKPARSETIFFQ
jgi:hypothetical protein